MNDRTDHDRTLDRVRELENEVARLKERLGRQDESQMEEVYQSLGALLPFGIWVADPEGRTRFLSRSFLEFVDLPFDRARDFGWTVCLPDEQAEKLRRDWQACVAAGSSWEREYELCGKGGTWRTVLSRGAPQCDGNGRILRWVGINLDVTERSRFRRRLRKEKERAETYIDVAGTVLVALDPEGRVTLINRRGCELLGLPKWEVFGKNWYDDFVAPDLRETSRALHAAMVSGRQPEVNNYENRIVDAGGREHWVSWYGTLLRDSDGTVTGALGSGVDVTEQRLAEARLLESETRFRSTFDNAAVGIAHVGLDGSWLRVNQRLCDIFGYTREELLETTFQDITHPDDIEQDTLLAGRLARGEIASYSMEKRYLRSDGTVVWTSLTGSAHRAADGTPGFFIAVIEDISRRKHLEEDLRRARDAAEDASRAKSEFLANVSHELRTPMSGVLGMLELVLDTSLDDQQRRFLTMAKTAADSLLQIINDILDFSRIEARQLEFDEDPFPVRACLESVVELLQSRAEEKGVALTTRVCESVPQIVLGDVDRLRQVLFNLVGNAVKFTEEGRIEVELSAAEPADRDPAETWTLQFRVSDTGIGIAAEDLPKLFKSFSQVDASLTRKHGGSGLGLAISRQIVERLGGTIRAESEPGAGSTFTFCIPFRTVAEIPAGGVPPDARPPAT